MAERPSPCCSPQTHSYIHARGTSHRDSPGKEARDNDGYAIYRVGPIQVKMCKIRKLLKAMSLKATDKKTQGSMWYHGAQLQLDGIRGKLLNKERYARSLG